MITSAHLQASANRARGLNNELMNIYGALCTPSGSKVAARDIYELAEDMRRAAERLEALAAKMR